MLMVFPPEFESLKCRSSVYPIPAPPPNLLSFFSLLPYSFKATLLPRCFHAIGSYPSRSVHVPKRAHRPLPQARERLRRSYCDFKIWFHSRRGGAPLFRLRRGLPHQPFFPLYRRTRCSALFHRRLSRHPRRHRSRNRIHPVVAQQSRWHPQCPVRTGTISASAFSRLPLLQKCHHIFLRNPFRRLKLSLLLAVQQCSVAF